MNEYFVQWQCALCLRQHKRGLDTDDKNQVNIFKVGCDDLNCYLTKRTMSQITVLALTQPVNLSCEEQDEP